MTPQRPHIETVRLAPRDPIRFRRFVSRNVLTATLFLVSALLLGKDLRIMSTAVAENAHQVASINACNQTYAFNVKKAVRQ